MLVTLLGIVTLVRLVQLKNASPPMLVTGKPLVVSGMVTAPPGPVYPVMVIAPLLVVQVNWACATAGSANSNSSGSSLLSQAALNRVGLVFGQVALTIELAGFTYCPFVLLLLNCPSRLTASGGGRNGYDNWSTGDR